MVKFFLSTLLGFTIFTHGYAQKIGISIFNDVKLSTILITPTAGSYKLITGDNQETLQINQILYLSRLGDSIVVKDANRNLGTWKRVTIVGQTGDDIIRVKPIMPANPARLYDDNFSFYVEYDRIMAINLIDQEKYIAAVVEAEGGPNREPEFYKAQSLIVRTYTISHLNRHSDEGFNLCDGVHCQAYKGRSDKDDDIYSATSDTKDLIIVDSTNTPITAAFHANCGGQTANSEDVWVKALPYLVSVPDKYCLSSRSAVWERRIPLSEWKKFIAEQGVDTAKILKPSEIDFYPKGRSKYYPVMGVDIPTSKIREHFKLRSAWFSVTAYKTEVKLSGKGYGHGVGLCQDGAMNMAARGWTYDKIIEYYYKGVKIINSNSINISNIKPDTLNVNDHVESNSDFPPPPDFINPPK